MLPLHDHNPTRRPAFVTWALIAACIVVYLFVQERPGEVEVVDVGGAGAVEIDRSLSFTLEYAAVPCEITQARPLTLDEVVDTYTTGDMEACAEDPSGPALFPGKGVWLAALTSIFLHGSLVHLLGNVWFLWIFGNNIEERFGHARYLAFYLAAGVAATAAHVLVQPDSSVPVVGASGAIAGVMGAYLILFPRAPVTTLIVWFIPFLTSISAMWLLGFWFISQFFTAPESSVAWMAHVAGFVFGVVVTLLLRGAVGGQLGRPVPSRT
jgi:membrane associated rhomboid family serine protease